MTAVVAIAAGSFLLAALVVNIVIVVAEWAEEKS